MVSLKRHRTGIVGLAVTAILLLVVFFGRREIALVFNTVLQVRKDWLFAAFLIQFAVYLSFAAVYWRSLALLGHRVKLMSMYGIAFVAIFLGRIFPAGGTSTYAFLLYQLRRRGVPDGTGAITVTLDGLSYYATFFSLLLAGFVYLFTQGQLRVNQVLFIVLIVLGIIFLVMYIWALHYDRPLLTRRALALKNRVARLLHRSWGDTGVLAFIAEVYDGMALVKRNRWGFLQLVGLQLVALLLDCLTILLLFRSLDVAPHFSIVLLGYCLANFFSAVTSLPGGGGSFEAAMTLTFTQLELRSEIAISVTLLYRLLAFWIPLFVAGIVYQYIQKGPSEPSSHRHVRLSASGSEGGSR
ncbi:MAG TPA: lysylphosphatidylglycerol synthase transmembrane domain-containing protein [Herpetosiphonaceae bacterium]|nr:lysylphosphatidylglycerol synthase transmembrane domain-containing protein [Herpetosiphonaceae bacterium]